MSDERNQRFGGVEVPTSLEIDPKSRGGICHPDFPILEAWKGFGGLESAGYLFVDAWPEPTVIEVDLCRVLDDCYPLTHCALASLLETGQCVFSRSSLPFGFTLEKGSWMRNHLIPFDLRLGKHHILLRRCSSSSAHTFALFLHRHLRLRLHFHFHLRG